MASSSTGNPPPVLLAVPPRTPAAAIHYKSDPAYNVLPVPTVQSQSLLGAVRSAFEKNNPRFFHYDPYEAHCRDPKTSKTYRLYGEAYESQRMLDAHRAVQQAVLDESCNLPRCVAAIMLFSDATQLADFGNAKAWPIRVSFGNLSKYERCKPDLQNHYEVGFMPSIILRILLATIRGMKSLRPCPRCLMPRAEFKNMGLASDLCRRQELKRVDNKKRNDLVHDARSIIYDEGRAVSSKKVEDLLKPHSYVPTNNAFSRRLYYLGFNIFESLVVDFLHEVELGVWKSVFQHLLRVLHSKSSSSVAILNERFRLVPPFGDGTIRPFSEDVSDMTRPAARNYEDILQ
ncbi:hypothetical protein FRC06_009912, partial [Ceratobasidium sp. 370]